jgi:ribonuclease E
MKMLINAAQKEELRVVIVEDKRVFDFDVERLGRERIESNIYKGRISRIEPSLNAVFVDYGAERHGFLPLKEISPEYFIKETKETSDTQGPINIKEVLKEGQEIIVQVDKGERGRKGAALTTYLSIAGCYLVLMPNNPGKGGISRRIEGKDRENLREILSQLPIPENAGIIVRTAGGGRSFEELDWDLKILLKHWDAIKNAAEQRPAPFLIHQESNLIMRAIRDYLRKDITEVVIDEPNAYEQVRNHMQSVRPDFVDCVKLYTGATPLFQHHQIESQIESAHQRTVQLPSGGSIVIDRTEALTTVDINSARATGGGDIEETALNTNLEAADEIARQLRLRDTGGLIVIDFIDMLSVTHQRMVESQLRESLHMDRARVQVGRISRFGLLEMSRQRLRSSLEESNLIICPRCSGYGSIRSIESLGLSFLRLLREHAIKPNTAQVRLQVPVEVATYMLNEKRLEVTSVQQETHTKILILANTLLETPHYHIERVRYDSEGRGQRSSYEIKYEPKAEPTSDNTSAPSEAEVPAVSMATITPTMPAPQIKAKRVGLLSKLKNLLAKAFRSKPKKKPTRTHRNHYQRKRSHHGRRRRYNQSKGSSSYKAKKRREGPYNETFSNHSNRKANYKSKATEKELVTEDN